MWILIWAAEGRWTVAVDASWTGLDWKFVSIGLALLCLWSTVVASS